MTLLSPEFEGATVVGARRSFVLKEAAALNSLINQFTTKHGEPNVSINNILVDS